MRVRCWRTGWRPTDAVAAARVAGLSRLSAGRQRPSRPGAGYGPRACPAHTAATPRSSPASRPSAAWPSVRHATGPLWHDNRTRQSAWRHCDGSPARWSRPRGPGAVQSHAGRCSAPRAERSLRAFPGIGSAGMVPARDGARCEGGMPPASRNHRVPTGCEIPVSTAASSLDKPEAIRDQKRRRSNCRATHGRPGECSLRLVDRSDFR